MTHHRVSLTASSRNEDGLGPAITALHATFYDVLHHPEGEQ